MYPNDIIGDVEKGTLKVNSDGCLYEVGMKKKDDENMMNEYRISVNQEITHVNANRMEICENKKDLLDFWKSAQRDFWNNIDNETQTSDVGEKRLFISEIIHIEGLNSPTSNFGES